MADSKPTGFNHVPGPQPHGADYAGRFAAAALPPHRDESGSGAKAAADPEAEIQAARIAAAHYDALYAAPPARRAFPRALTMLLIFAIGACAGVGSAWWIVGSDAAASHARPNLPALAALHEDAETDAAKAQRGIRAGELPYDGVPPDPVRADTPSAAPASGSRQANATLERPQASTVPPDTPARKTQRPRMQAKSSKDKEIERPLEQVDEELKKKAEPASAGARRSAPGRSVEQVSLSTRGAGSASMKTRLARCERQSNIFAREQCRWRLCGDSWGKNGCPSYAVKNEPY